MKFTDVNPFNTNIQKKINKNILNTVKKGDFILGKNVLEFEKETVICENENISSESVLFDKESTVFLFSCAFSL